MYQRSRCTQVFQSIVSACLIALAFSTPLAAQQPSTQATVPDWAEGSLVEVPVDELKVRLMPLDIETLELLRADIMDRMRVNAIELSDAIVARLKLAKAGDESDQDINAVGKRTIELMIGKQQLLARADVVIDALEAKGGEVASDKAYLATVRSLRPDLAETVGRNPSQARVTDKSNEVMQARVAELVAMVRAERPVHERDKPWDVPVSELELELQPLTTEQVLERLEKWQAMLQQQVRERIRMDILLNDSEKLERNLEIRNEAAMLMGIAAEDVSVDDLRAVLAQQIEAQQQVIMAITDRMKAAIEIVKRRGGDAQSFVDYIASATGRKLNFTDLSVLRVQILQWLVSPSGGRLIALNVLLFAGITALFWVLSRFIGLITRYASRRIPKSSTLLGPVLAGVVEKLTLLVGLVVAAGAVGVNTGPLLAMIGAAGLVIGLALQGTLSNFASGIMILLNRPFDVGDIVDAGGVFGKVEAMNLVSTTILTFDNQLMLVPNNQIWNSVITNLTGKDTRRVDLTFGIAYGSEIAKATEILEELLSAHPKTLDDPAPMVRVHELADNSVNLIARPWVRTADYWEVHWDLMRQVKERFDEEGVNIPFPQRDLHIPNAIEVRLAGTHVASPGSGAAVRSEGRAAARPTRESGAVIAEPGPPHDTAEPSEESSESN
jgi:small conductance mechanosensitive channel